MTSVSQPKARISWGTACSSAVALVPTPPWCTIASHVGSRSLSGTKSTMRTLSGRSLAASRVASSTVATISASSSARWARSSAMSTPTSEAEEPSVTQTRLRPGSARSQSGTTAGPLYGTWRTCTVGSFRSSWVLGGVVLTVHWPVTMSSSNPASDPSRRSVRSSHSAVGSSRCSGSCSAASRKNSLRARTLMSGPETSRQCAAPVTRAAMAPARVKVSQTTRSGCQERAKSTRASTMVSLLSAP